MGGACGSRRGLGLCPTEPSNGTRDPSRESCPAASAHGVPLTGQRGRFQPAASHSAPCCRHAWQTPGPTERLGRRRWCCLSLSSAGSLFARDTAAGRGAAAAAAGRAGPAGMQLRGGKRGPGRGHGGGSGGPRVPPRGSRDGEGVSGTAPAPPRAAPPAVPHMHACPGEPRHAPPALRGVRPRGLPRVSGHPRGRGRRRGTD